MNAECFQLSNYLAELGGTLGLWIGMSIFTVLEVCELVVDLVRMCVAKRPCQRPPQGHKEQRQPSMAMHTMDASVTSDNSSEPHVSSSSRNLLTP